MRALFFNFGWGVTNETWFPDVKQTGADYALPPGLAPLARHKADITVVQGLSNKYANEAHWGSTFWLTGANRYAEPGQSFHNSISVDQVIAAQLGRDTRFASLQLNSVDVANSGHGPGLSLAWDTRGKPIAGLDNPVLAYHRLFSSDATPLEQRQAMIAEKRSVLDAVLTDARDLQRGLTKTDTDKLDEYFQSIRDIETRLGKDEQWLTVPKPKSALAEPGSGLAGRDEVKLMYDLIVNTQLYRDFDESTKAAARHEVYQTFEYLLRNRQGLGSLLKSDFVIVNGLLAGFYGLEGVSGDEFRKVQLPADSPRGGLLGMAAIMAMGSNGEQSSTVERGAWVLRKLLHDSPPPAPPNVPQLTRLEDKLLTSRERLLAHQEEPQCASCHRKIDPIGFGLENFNAVGKWRTHDAYEKRGVGKKEWQIDPSGAFHQGPAFKSYFELRDLIAEREEDFARGFTENLIEYALGRPYGFADDELAANIVVRAIKQDLSVRELVQALVASDAFRSK